MSLIGSNTNLGSGIRAISLFASVAVHAMVLAGIPALIGETGTGPAASSSSLHLSVYRTDPADDIPKDNQDHNPLEQVRAQPPVHSQQDPNIVQQQRPLPDVLKARATSTKAPVKQDPKDIPAPSTTAAPQPASNKMGADVKKIQPVQVATSGRTPRLTRNYQSTLQRIIERHKYYPLEARRNGMEGTSTVAFTISNNGSISGITLTKSSGISLLDHAAIQTIRRIGNAPPLPDDIRRSQWRFAIPIAYNLK